MESDLQQQHHLHDLQHHNQPRQLNSGLTRYQSAPSSYFSSFLDTEFCEDFLNRPPSPETERIFDRFLSNESGKASENTNMMEAEPPQPPPQQQQQGNYSASRSFYQNQSQSQQTLQNLNSGYGAMNSVGMDRFPPTKTANGGGNNSNLIRHSSSPAGLFADIEIENGYVVMKDYGRPPAPPAPAPPTTSSGNNTASFIEDQSSNYSTDLSAAAETQNVQLGNRPPRLLAHHLSLPKDLSAIENLLQFQDSVPCKIRAKRGFATHPRSIAERVRRTKISERMRKLQDLVPNMDKQTNTADMLDLAVDYVKELRNQVKALSDKRGKCTCSNKQEQP